MLIRLASSRVMLLTVLAVASIALASACTGADKAGPPPPGYYGEFQFSRYTQTVPGTGTRVFLYADVRFTTSNGHLDAGSRVTFTGPAGDVDLVRREFLGKIFYQKDPEGPDIPLNLFGPEATYSMHVSGSHRDQGVPAFELAPVLTTPQTFVLTAPDLSPGVIVVDGSADLPLTWTAGDGDYVDVILATVGSNGVANTISYRVADDGGFDVLASGISTLSDGTGSITIVRIINHTDHVLPFQGTGLGIGGDAVACTLIKQ